MELRTALLRCFSMRLLAVRLKQRGLRANVGALPLQISGNPRQQVHNVQRSQQNINSYRMLFRYLADGYHLYVYHTYQNL